MLVGDGWKGGWQQDGPDVTVITQADYWEGFGQRFTLLSPRVNGTNTFVVPLEGVTRTSRVVLTDTRMDGSVHFGSWVTYRHSSAGFQSWSLSCSDGMQYQGMAPYDGTLYVTEGAKCSLTMHSMSHTRCSRGIEQEIFTRYCSGTVNYIEYGRGWKGGQASCGPSYCYIQTEDYWEGFVRGVGLELARVDERFADRPRVIAPRVGRANATPSSLLA